MEIQKAEISVKGVVVKVPVTSIGGRSIVTAGRLLKMACCHDEEWIQDTPIDRPHEFVEALKKVRPRPDLFSFADAEPAREPRFQCHIEWDNVAVIPIETYASWWESLSQESRRNVRIAEKRGVSVKAVSFDDAFVAGIKGI